MSARDPEIPELDAALGQLRELSPKQKPGHRHARAVLVPLGITILEQGEDAALGAAARVQAAVEPFGDAWTDAVDAELRMACTEHIQSVDPRYLDLPNYDFAYTMAARERLEARLAASGLLGYAPPEDLLDRVAKADATLAPYLERSRPRGGGEA